MRKRNLAYYQMNKHEAPKVSLRQAFRIGSHALLGASLVLMGGAAWVLLIHGLGG